VIFSSKQLERIENIHDSSGRFDEENSENSNENDNGDGAMEWRRGMLEEATESVKRARTRPVDPSITYEIKSMLFDRESRRFARVSASVPGYLRLQYLTGGDREYGLLDVDQYLVEFGSTKSVSELAKQLGLDFQSVAEHLESLDIVPLPEKVDPKKRSKKEGKKSRAPAKAKAVKAAPAAPTKAKAKVAKPKSRGKSKDNGDANDPIGSPNAFIKQHYMEQSNRELARETGLSEHTIRRKLGEWGLKRKKR